MPWAARRAPALNWGDARGGQRLLDHLARTQYGGEAVAETSERLGFIGEELFLQWPLLLFLCALGLPTLWAWRASRPLCGVLLACVGLGAAVLYGSNRFALEEPARWRLAGAHTPLVVCVSALCVLVLVALERRWMHKMPRVRTSPLWALVSLLCANSARPTTLAPALDQSKAHAAQQYAEEALEACPPGAVLVVSRAGYGDVLHFPLLYAQIALGRRPDVLLIDREMLGHAWYREQLGRAEPSLAGPLEELGRALAHPSLAGDPRLRRLANLPFLHRVFDGERPAVLVGRTSPRLLDGRRALPDHALWHIVARGGPRAGQDSRTARGERRPGGLWLPGEDVDPWVAEMRRLNEVRENARRFAD